MAAARIGGTALPINVAREPRLSTASNFVATPQAGNGNARIGLDAFWLSPDLLTAYIADAETAPPSGTANPGIKKYTRPDTSSAFSTTPTSIANIGTEIRYMTVDNSGAVPVVYFVGGSQNTLYAMTDNGGSGFGTPVQIATADANTEFRGVVFTPVPEPTAIGLCMLGGVLTLARRRRA